MAHSSHAAKAPRATPKHEARSLKEAGEGLGLAIPLDTFLNRLAGRGRDNSALAALVARLAKAAIHLAEEISLGAIAGGEGVPVGTAGLARDAQRRIDTLAKEIFVDALCRAPVSAILPGEGSSALDQDSSAPYAVAIDALDGSSDFDANAAMGTLFGVFPTLEKASQPADHFLRPGHDQVAAGLILYGPQTSLVFTLGEGVHAFTLDRRCGSFQLVMPRLAIPEDSTEYAVDASNYRHWDDSVRAYIDDCTKGKEGPFFRDHNLRWIDSLVADAYRILVRGGVFLSPGDQRRDYRNGRLHLIFEANPVAFLVEQAGGGATDTVQRILDIRPKELHAKTPIVFGSFAPVQRISRYHTDPQYSAERAPLFFQRGLIRR